MKSLSLLVALLGGAAAQVTVAQSANAPAGCKPIPGDSNWPADDIWTKELPGVVRSPPSEGNITRPDYVLTALNVADVQAAVKFVGKHNVRLSIINSGHDFLGRNDAPNGLWLVLANLKGARVAESFNPSTSGVLAVNNTLDPIHSVNVIKPLPGKQAYVTFGAGVSGQELNDALHKSGLFTICAAAGQVRPAGGYGQNGGHSPFSSKYGLAADNFVELKVVTADGVLRVVNSVVEKDLFWALRGGGGGTFGVVVEATMKAFPTPQITMTKWWIKTTGMNDTEGIFAPAAYLHSQFPALNSHGVQGYYFVYPTSAWGEFFTADGESGINKAKELWKPVFAGMEKYPGMGKVIYQYSDYGDYKAWFDRVFGPLGPSEPSSAPIELEGPTPRGISPLDSRLLGASHLESPKLEAALRNSMPTKNGQLRGHLVGGGQVAVSGSDTSVLPAWRSSLVHLIASGREGLDATPLKQLAPETGCYANECSRRETTYKRTMFGQNYERLYSIKTRFDPNGLFWASPGVGADDAEIVAGRLCKARKTVTASSLGMAPENDNRNMVQPKGSTYRAFPESQEAADKEVRKTGS